MKGSICPGLRFGRLVVIRHAGYNKWRRSRWECLCDCGKLCIVGVANLGRDTHSCGCLKIETLPTAARKHGCKGTAEYRTWIGIKNRCFNPRSTGFHRYGGRGITICERWQHSFEDFLADMGPRPSPQHSIERINNNGNYEPTNCCWATPEIQQANTCASVRVTHDGVSLTISQWAKRTGIPDGTLRTRLRAGWSHAAIITTPVRPWSRGVPRMGRV